MFETLHQSIDRSTSRFSRNVAKLAGDRSIKPPAAWTHQDERRYVGILIAAGFLTLWQWIALPFRLLRGARLR